MSCKVQSITERVNLYVIKSLYFYHVMCNYMLSFLFSVIYTHLVFDYVIRESVLNKKKLLFLSTQLIVFVYYNYLQS